jgi:hypothetical protein
MQPKAACRLVQGGCLPCRQQAAPLLQVLPSLLPQTLAQLLRLRSVLQPAVVSAPAQPLLQQQPVALRQAVHSGQTHLLLLLAMC